jgi:hypothetical protein
VAGRRAAFLTSTSFTKRCAASLERTVNRGTYQNRPPSPPASRRRVGTVLLSKIRCLNQDVRGYVARLCANRESHHREVSQVRSARRANGPSVSRHDQKSGRLHFNLTAYSFDTSNLFDFVYIMCSNRCCNVGIWRIRQTHYTA